MAATLRLPAPLLKWDIAPILTDHPRPQSRIRPCPIFARMGIRLTSPMGRTRGEACLAPHRHGAGLALPPPEMETIMVRIVMCLTATPLNMELAVGRMAPSPVHPPYHRKPVGYVTVTIR